MKFELLSLVLALGTISRAQAATDFRAARGTAVIAAPTALGGETNQGIWFVKGAKNDFSLSLPALPADQVYEGWIDNERTGQRISVGLFREKGGIDSDAAGPLAGPLALNFPPVPGSDFVKLGSITEGDFDVIVTVEPYPDADPVAPGPTVLRARIPAGAKAGAKLVLENVAR